MRYKLPNTERLYGQGGFYDGELLLSDIQPLAFSGRQVRDLGDVFPGDFYHREAPHVYAADEEFRKNLNHIVDAISRDYNTVAPAIAYEIQGCIIHDTVLYFVENGRASILQTTHRSHERPHVNILDGPNGVFLANKHLDGKRNYFFLSSAASFNYGHWLIDDLPKIKFLADQVEPFTILLQSYGPAMDRVRMESVKYFLPNTVLEFQFIDKRDLVVCDRVTYVTPVSYHPMLKNRYALEYLRSNIKGRDEVIQPTEGRRIFVNRKPSGTRNIVNNDEVRSLFAKLGFEIVETEDYSFADQVDLFSSASLVVGIMGASMCNTVFSKPGTKVIYLAPSGWVEPFYWDLAALLGHSYTAVYGDRAFRIDDAPFDDFTVDVQELSQLVQF